MESRLTKEQQEVFAALKERGLCFIADSAKRRWEMGRRYYIDLRIDAKGLRHRFEKANKQAIDV